MILDLIQQYPFVPSFLFGLIPALIWLWFWLKEDRHPEPAKMIALSFLGGMLAVAAVLPMERLAYDYIQERNTLAFAVWAAMEEICKFIIVYYIALRQKVTDEPVDDIIYLIVSALGFVAMENTLFLINTVHSGNFIDTIITGNLRFIGASLLHIISSATVGICMALAFYKSALRKKIYLVIGLILATILHTAFNLFIIEQSDGNIFLVFGAVWVCIAILLLLFEKIKYIHR